MGFQRQINRGFYVKESISLYFANSLRALNENRDGDISSLIHVLQISKGTQGIFGFLKPQ